MALAVAFPFLFSYTQPPSTNFWPLMAAGLCGWVVAVVGMHAQQAALTLCGGGWIAPRWPPGLARACCWPPCCGAISLLQYFGAAPGLDPRVHTAKPAEPWAICGSATSEPRCSAWGCGLCCRWWRRPRRIACVIGGRSSAQAGADFAWGRSALASVAGRDSDGLGAGLLAVGSAATASRTGLAQLLVILVLLALWLRFSQTGLRSGWCWRAWPFMRLQPGCCPICCCNGYGFRAEGLFARFGDAPGCTSRRCCGYNVLHLIAQKPWLGWGWGVGLCAFPVTLFPGERFCVLLDNAQ